MRNQHLLITDFDGVLCDSVYECFLVGWRAWQKLINADRLKTIEDTPDELWAIFKKLRPQARIAEGFLEIFNKFADESEHIDVASNKVKFVDSFYKEREQIKKHNFDEWLRINPPFAQAVKVINSWSSVVSVYIVSVKDVESVIELVKYYDLNIPLENIFAGYNLNKYQTIANILSKTNKDSNNSVFIDDYPKNLQSCFPLGIHLILASWGYVPPNGEKKALQIGANIATLNNFHNILKSKFNKE